MKPVDRIKKARREAQLMRVISRLLVLQAADDPELHGFSVTRVELNADNSICSVFFYGEGGEELFKQKLNYFKLYKPSLRAAIAQEISSRYTPNIVFRFDDQFEKQMAIERLLDTVKDVS